MATKFYRLLTRPSVAVEFPTDSPEFLQYIQDAFISTGMCLSFRATEYTPDNLTKIMVSTWASDEAFEAALSDPIWGPNNDYIKRYTEEHNILKHEWSE